MAHPELDRFEQLYRLAGKLVAEADNEEVAEAARILAPELAQFQTKYRELLADEHESLAAVDRLPPGLAKTLGDSMGNLAGDLT